MDNKTKTPMLLDALFKNLPLSVLGEWIASTIFFLIVHYEEQKYITGWYIIQCINLLIQLYVPLSYNYNVMKLPFNYLYLYLITLSGTFLTMPYLALAYNFGNIHIVLVLGIIYVAITSGASLFHCHIKYAHTAHIFSIFSAYTYLCFSIGGTFFYLGLGSILYSTVVAFVAFRNHEYLSQRFELAIQKEQHLKNLIRYNHLLELKTEELKQEEAKHKIIEIELLKTNDHLLKNKEEIEKNNISRQSILSFIYNASEHMIIKTDYQGNVIEFNEKFIDFFKIRSQQDLQQFPQNLLKQIPSQHVLNRFFPFTNNPPTEKNFHIELENKLHLNLNVKIVKKYHHLENIWFIQDITREVLQEQMLFKITHYDELTNLPNRKTLHEKLHVFKEQADRKNLLFALAFIDINDFKIINDTQGHSMGNEILKTFANRLISNIRPIDFTGRLGGDEFICVFNDLKYKSDVDSVIERLKNVLEKPIDVGEDTLIINASIGVSYYPCDTTSLDELMSFADIAMYKAKENRKALYERFLPEYTEYMKLMHEMGQNLKNAIVNNMLYLAYQPIFDSGKNNIQKIEVLLRWKEDILPNVFIPLAEKLGLIHDITVWVIKQSCEMRKSIANWIDDDVKFAINISHKEFQATDNIQELISLIKNAECPEKWIEFEITENCLIDFEKASQYINLFKKQGISVALDNFGTGFSSLSFLKTLEFDTIKIDKEFASNIFHVPKEMNILKGMIKLIKKLDTKITIEGVESKEIYDFCVEQECELLQGYYLSKPVDFDTLEKKLKSQNKKSKVNILEDKS